MGKNKIIEVKMEQMLQLKVGCLDFGLVRN